MQRTFRLAVLLVVSTGLHIVTGVRATPPEQAVPTATPVPISLPSALPIVPQEAQQTATETPTRTPTPPGPALLEALTEANVRAQPDPESERVGIIRSGDMYPIIGRFFRWFQFQFDPSPSGTGWVFDELVRVIGDESTIIDLSENAVPTLDPVTAAATQTLGIITQTPGGILTVTAAAGSVPLPALPGADVPVGQSTLELPSEEGILPTFTYPPNVAALVPTSIGIDVTDTPPAPASDTALRLPNGIPPIVPVLVLGGLGVLGLVINSYRRR